MSNDALVVRLNDLKTKVDRLKFQKEQNDLNKIKLYEELKKYDITDIVQLKSTIDKETADISELNKKLEESLVTVEKKAQELENRVNGKTATEGISL